MAFNLRAQAAQSMLGAPISRAGAPQSRNRLGEALTTAGQIGLGALGGRYGQGAADFVGGLFKPRNPALIAAAQHPKHSLEADRAWSMAGGGE